jgi:hypothetical protein
LKPLVEFYVEQHNAVMPHAAFDGQTPDEMFAAQPPMNLAERRREARMRRIEINRSKSCGACSHDDLSSDSRRSQLRWPESQMRRRAAVIAAISHSW